MKKPFYLIALLFLSFSIISCKDDDDEVVVPLPVVVGKWTVDYGIISGLTSANSLGLENGHKIDPHNQIFWGYDFPLNTIHILNDKNLFVNIYKPGVLAETYAGKWSYTSPELTLDYDEASIPDEKYKYNVVDGLEQLEIPQAIRLDSLGTSTFTINWVYHK